MARLLAAVSLLGATACSVVGIRAEEQPKYRVAAHVGVVEIREYGSRIAAETAVPGEEYAARSTGFRRVAGYIFGGNRSRESIAMTAPVAVSRQTIAMTAPVAQMRDESGAWVVRFIMPASYTMQTLPVPDNPEVRLVELPPETFAVLRFTGSVSPDSVASERAALLAALDGSAWRASGEPVAWFYDPPWTLPFLRRNEVAVPVAAR